MEELLHKIVTLINVVLPGLPQDMRDDLKNDVFAIMCKTGDDMYAAMQSMNI